jgi:hypothetical protein
MKIALSILVASSTMLLTSAISLILYSNAANSSLPVRLSVVHETAMKADTNIDWEKMSKADRKQYMKDAVMPKMKPLFQTLDPKKFADFKCVTCHGNGARTGEFKMPNPQLPKLPVTREGFEKLNTKMPKMMEFMSKTVKPTMASLLGMKEYDMKTGTGFGCNNCHTPEKK